MEPGVASATSQADARGAGWRTVGRNVWLLGLTSLVTDVSSEMVASVLPVYLLFQVHLSPATYGLVEGLHQGGASIARIGSGLLTDRLRRYKEIAVAGYAASAFCRIGLLLAGASAGAIAAVTLLDRLGKGTRTSPRDALISLSAPPRGMAAAFGVHRTLDTIGATLGPLLAFAVLRWTRNDFAIVFVVSFALALIGVATLAAFVTNPPGSRTPPTIGPIVLRRAIATLPLERQFRGVAVCATGLGLAAIGDSLVYLVLQRRTGFATSWLPLLYVATPAAFALGAMPFGWLADRVGRGIVVVVGYVALLMLYVLLLMSSGNLATVVAAILLLGAYYAASDGVLPALAGSVLPEALRATGLSLVGTCHDVGRLAASLAFGWLWARGTVDQALAACAVITTVALLVAAPRLLRFDAEPL